MLTDDVFRALLVEYVGVAFEPEDRERLRAVVERQQARMRELHAIDFGGDDPRTTQYVEDFRLPRYA
ncbi:MAG TPA: hypothetical protein VFC51_11935 [Chloroflexota bacterium]|nr:hypothetical protein [Chloroflexota bacterium]